MTISEFEHVLGRQPVASALCDSGSIRVYPYDRGVLGCLESGACSEEDVAKFKNAELGLAVLTFGISSRFATQCFKPCQEGHLYTFFSDDGTLIGLTERPSNRKGYCWIRGNKEHLGYPCDRIFENRKPSTIPEVLVIDSATASAMTDTCDPLESVRRFRE